MNIALFIRSIFRTYGFLPKRDISKSKTTISIENEPDELTPSNKVLQDVDGVGPKYEAKLNDNDITSVNELANISSSELSKKVNISEDYANRWISSAKKLVN